MVGESGTQSDYDEEWEKLLDSGILEELLQKAEVENAVKQATQADVPDSELVSLVQKAEQESAVKRASQVVPTIPTPLSRQGRGPPPSLPVDAHIPSFQPSCILSTSVPATNPTQAPDRSQLLSENGFHTRSHVLHGPRKPPLPSDLRDSQGYHHDRYGGTHQPINLSQIPTQTPGSFKYGTPMNGALSTSYQLLNGVSNGVSGLHRDGEILQLRNKLLQVNGEERTLFRVQLVSSFSLYQ